MNTIDVGGKGTRRALLVNASSRIESYWILCNVSVNRHIRGAHIRGALIEAQCALLDRIRRDAEWALERGLLLHFGVVK